MPGSAYLGREQRKEFADLLGSLYDAGSGLHEVKDPIRFKVTSGLGTSATAEVFDYEEPILSTAQCPRLSVRTDSAASRRTVLQNELTVFSGEPTSDRARYRRPQVSYMVNNPNIFTEETDQACPDDKQAVVRSYTTVAKLPEADFFDPVTTEAFGTYVQGNPYEVSAMNSTDARWSASEPVVSSRPMTVDDLAHVRSLVGQVIDLD